MHLIFRHKYMVIVISWCIQYISSTIFLRSGQCSTMFSTDYFPDRLVQHFIQFGYFSYGQCSTIFSTYISMIWLEQHLIQCRYSSDLVSVDLVRAAPCSVPISQIWSVQHLIRTESTNPVSAAPCSVPMFLNLVYAAHIQNIYTSDMVYQHIGLMFPSDNPQ